MPSLIDIKKRINATKSTKKITKAMQLVAASKMKAFQRSSVHVQTYVRRLLEALRLCGVSLMETRYARPGEGDTTLFLLLTSDKGLCGAMNNKLIRTLFRSEAWLNAEGSRELITVGRKAGEAARGAGMETLAQYAGLVEQLTPLEGLKVIHTVLERWESGEIKNVILVAPEYVNPFVFNVQLRNMLPLTPETVAEMIDMRARDLETAPESANLEAAFFEPSQEGAVKRIAKQVVQSLFTEAFYELKATEYSSRMVAMKKATEAADERIKELTNVYNKARQGAITQELSELAAANEAMSSQDVYEVTHV